MGRGSARYEGGRSVLGLITESLSAPHGHCPEVSEFVRSPVTRPERARPCRSALAICENILPSESSPSTHSFAHSFIQLFSLGPLVPRPWGHSGAW